MKIIDGLIGDIPDEQQARNVAYKIFLIITGTIFIVENLIMLLIMGRSGIYSYNIVMTDALVLTLVISPMLYFLFLNPLLVNISKRVAGQHLLERINQKLNYESQRLFKVLDDLPAALHLLDRSYKIVFANRTFRENFGEIQGQPCYKLLHDLQEPCEICKTFEVFDGNSLEEHEIQRRNGRMYNVYNYPFTDTDGQQLVLQLAIDITDRKKAENDLLQRERQLKLVLNSMSDTLYTVDRNECITAIYGEGLKNSGINTANLIGRKISDLFEPEKLSEFREVFEKVLKGENTFLSWETELPTGNLYFHNSLSPVFDEQGNVTHITGIARNVTQQKMLDRKIIETEKLMTVGRMSAMISHEFRNSLTSVRMILELLEESEDVKPKEKKSLDVALRSVSGMENIVNQLLDFARPSQTTLGRCDINKIIEESIHLTAAQFKKNGITLVKTLDIKSSFLHADCLKLKEAFVNIIINAVQAISDNPSSALKKEITISTRAMKLGRPLWNMAVFEKNKGQSECQVIWEEKFDNTLPAGSNVLRVSFSDSGPGVKKNHLNHIFDSFFTTRKEGTGLGLAVVKRTVAEHNGVIIISSKENHSTDISIYLNNEPIDEEQI